MSLTQPGSNPFATRFVAPGRLPWIGHGQHTLPALLRRLEEVGRRAQIVGPHGSGKSTLLAHLVPLLGRLVHHEGSMSLPEVSMSYSESLVPSLPLQERRSQGTYWFQLRRGQPVMRSMLRKLGSLKQNDTLVLDGFEQLSPLTRWLVVFWTYWRGAGLLVTSHQMANLPLLIRTEVSAELAQQVVEAAWNSTRGSDQLPDQLKCMQLDRLLQEHRGNLRECLMYLYDVIESRSHSDNGEEN